MKKQEDHFGYEGTKNGNIFQNKLYTTTKNQPTRKITRKKKTNKQKTNFFILDYYK